MRNLPSHIATIMEKNVNTKLKDQALPTLPLGSPSQEEKGFDITLRLFESTSLILQMPIMLCSASA